MHVKIENGILGVGMVFTVHGLQTVFGIGEHTTHIVIAHFRSHIVVEHVGLQLHVAVDEPYLSSGIGIKHGKFCLAVVVELVGIHKQCVALLHPHVAEGIHGIGLLVEIRAVAEHEHAALAHLHVACEHLILLIFLVVGLFVMEHVGVLQKHLVVLIAVGLRNHRLYHLCLLRAGGAGSAALLGSGATDGRQNHGQHERRSCQAPEPCYFFASFIHPLCWKSQLRHPSSMRTYVSAIFFSIHSSRISARRAFSYMFFTVW